MLTFSCFISGTDTEVGKTWITLGIMQGFIRRGYNVAGMKPIASGSVVENGDLRNEDAVKIQALCSHKIPYSLINPYAFQEPIAPHLAAQKQGLDIQLPPIIDAYQEISSKVDIVIVEGVGGWRVPISESTQTVDLVNMLDIPVILVVGLRLGCINHALLSAEALLNDGISLLGWVANQVDPTYGQIEETINSISSAIPAPLLGKVPYLAEMNPADTEKSLDRQLFDVGD